MAESPQRQMEFGMHAHGPVSGEPGWLENNLHAMKSPLLKPFSLTGAIASLRVLCYLAAVFGAAGLRAQEMSFLAGGTTSPDLESSSYAWEIEYRQHLYRNLSASVGWLNE